MTDGKCASCQEEKDAGQLMRISKTGYGIAYQCTECRKEKVEVPASSFRKSTPEERLARNREWKRKNLAKKRTKTPPPATATTGPTSAVVELVGALHRARQQIDDLIATFEAIGIKWDGT